MKNLSKSTIALIGLGCVVVFVAMLWMGIYNSIVGLDQSVEKSWAQVQNVYQRRADLIPNLVETVKGYAKHEERVFTEVTEARSKVGSINVNAGALAESPELQQKFLSAQKDLGSALGRLIAVSENYPNLKADQSFLKLQDQLEGTENRITNERRNNQEAIRAYNSRIKRFPANLIASFHSFTTRQYFQADDGAERAPKVNFNS